MPREPPVTRATLPVSFLVIGFLRGSNSVRPWICRPMWYRNRNYRNTLFPNLCSRERPNAKTPGLRRPRDFRESRGIAVICGGGRRSGAVQGHGVEGGEPARGAAGARLFNRTSRRLALTDAGQKLSERATRLL